MLRKQLLLHDMEGNMNTVNRPIWPYLKERLGTHLAMKVLGTIRSVCPKTLASRILEEATVADLQMAVRSVGTPMKFIIRMGIDRSHDEDLLDVLRTIISSGVSTNGGDPTELVLEKVEADPDYRAKLRAALGL